MEKLTNNRQDLVLQQFLRCSGDYKIIGVPYKVYLVAGIDALFTVCLKPSFQYRLQSVKGHIGKGRRYDTALRRAFNRRE